MRENSPVIRHWDMLKLIARNSDGKDIKTLAKNLGVSTRTVRRDLVMLRTLGIPISEAVTKFGRKKWRFNHAIFAREDLTFTYDEVAALYVGCRYFIPLQDTIIGKAMRSALEKTKLCLGAGASLFFDRIHQGFHISYSGWSNYEDKLKSIDTIMLALEEKKKIRFIYHRLEGDELVLAIPYYMHFHNGVLYLMGQMEQNESLCIWLVNRMEDVSLTRNCFHSVGNQSPVQINRIFGLFADEPVAKQEEICIRILSRECVRYFLEHRWNESQRMVKQPDGSFTMHLKMERTHDLVHWLLSFGHHIEVISPPNLKFQFQKELDALKSVYRS